MVLTAMDLGIAIAAFTSAVESTKGGMVFCMHQCGDVTCTIVSE
jgi:hypothetical protein